MSLNFYKNYKNQQIIKKVHSAIESANYVKGLPAMTPNFVQWAKYPLQRRSEVLLKVYREKEWITQNEYNNLKDQTPEFILHSLEKICLQKAKLRNPQTPVNVITVTQQDLKEKKWIKDILQQNNISQDNLKIRRIYQNRVSYAFKNGTDRNKNSMKKNIHHGWNQGEPLALWRAGATVEQSTYAWDFNPEKHNILTFHPLCSYLIYSGDTLEWATPTPDAKSCVNNFSVFHFTGEVTKRSLIAILTPHFPLDYNPMNEWTIYRTIHPNSKLSFI